MKRNTFTLTSLNLFLFSDLFTLTGATCNKYTPSSDINKQLHSSRHDFQGEPIQMSHAFTCREGMPSNYYNCYSSEGELRSCGLDAKGVLMGQGVTNVTMSDNEAEHLFDIVNKELPKRYGGWHDIHYKTAGCLGHRTFLPGNICLREGESGYITATQLRFCSEGTVSQCSGNGSLKDGMAVQVCGPQVWDKHGDNEIASYWLRLKRVDASEVESLQMYPANNTEGRRMCEQITGNGSSGLAITPMSWLMLFGTIAATLMGYELVF